MNAVIDKKSVPHVHSCEWCGAKYKDCDESACAAIPTYGNCDMDCFVGKRTYNSRHGQDIRPGQKKIAELTPEQDQRYCQFFEIASGQGMSPKAADQEAWKGLCEEWPELLAFDGCH